LSEFGANVGEPPRRRGWVVFWEGLTQPSLTASLGSLIVALGLLGICVGGLDQRAIADARFASFEGDDFAWLAAAALELPNLAGSEGPGVLIMASSSGREAITSAPALEAAIGAPRLPVHLWVAGGLTHLEMAALVEQLPPQGELLVLVEVSERNWGMPAEEHQELLDRPRLPLRSPTQDNLAASVGLRPRTQLPSVFLDQSGFFLARTRSVRRLWRPLIGPLLHQVENLPPVTPSEWQRLGRRVISWSARVPASADLNEAIYAGLIAAIQARGHRVVLTEALRNPMLVSAAEADPAGGAGLRVYWSKIRAFAQKQGVPYLVLASDAKLKAADFIDYAHLYRPEARYRYTAVLGRAVRRVLGPGVGSTGETGRFQPVLGPVPGHGLGPAGAGMPPPAAGGPPLGPPPTKGGI
jgi:hypothetical protein